MLYELDTRHFGRYNPSARNRRYIPKFKRPRRLAARIRDFHSLDRGSIPLGGIGRNCSPTGNWKLVTLKNKFNRKVFVIRRNRNMMHWNRNTVFSTVAALSAFGFAWFTFVSPETVNAVTKANYCLVGFFAALAAYYYSQLKETQCDDRISGVYTQMDRNFDDLNRRIDGEVDSLHTKVDHLNEKCSLTCDRKGR
jgi:hypothetical protein